MQNEKIEIENITNSKIGTIKKDPVILNLRLRFRKQNRKNIRN